MNIDSLQFRQRAAIFGILFAALCGFAGEWSSRFAADGGFDAGGVRVYCGLAERGWNWSKWNADTLKPAPGYPQENASGWFWKGTLATEGGNAVVTRSISRDADGATVLELSVTPPEKMALDFVGFQMILPPQKFGGSSVRIDDSEVVLPPDPPESEKWQILSSADRFQLCELRLDNFRRRLLISSSGGYLLHPVELRLPAVPAAGSPREYRAEIRIEEARREMRPLDLRPVMNRGFRDPVAGDGAGGWTDQGPTNDLAMMTPGLQTLGGVDFQVVDPAKNNGCSALVFNDRERETKTVSVAGESFRTLCVLHATTGAPSGVRVGEIEIVYCDGSTAVLPVRSGVEVGNWWRPVSLPRAQVFWEKPAVDGGLRGLFTGIFDVENKPVEKMIFRNGDEKGQPREWMIVAATGSRSPLPNWSVPETFRITASDEWRPFDIDKEIEPGSILDFSFLNTKPAGRDGWLIARNGRLEFEGLPGRPVRLFGANVCASAVFPEHAEAPGIARRFAALGYNTLRFHHLDYFLEPPGTTEFDPEKLDRMDYFFAALKAEGITVSMDLYSMRSAVGKIPGIDGGFFINEYRSLAMLHPGAKADFERYAAQLLNHVNPYTGLAYKDDPALISLCVLNEGNLERGLQYSENPAVKQFFQDEFEHWLRAGNHSTPDTAQRGKLWLDFLFEVQIRDFRDKKAFLRNLGVKQLLTNLNMLANPRLSLLRDELDFVDNHGYWDHPSPIPLPAMLSNRSAIDSMAVQPFGEWFPSRILGRGFTVTEYNFCYPNQFRAEGGALIGAYSALQGYEALYRFAYAGYRQCYSNSEINISTLDYGAKEGNERISNRSIFGGFDVVNDPVSLFSDRIAVLLFRRGDVAESKLILPVRVRRAERGNEEAWPLEVKYLGLAGKTGSVVESAAGTFAAFAPTAVKLPGDPETQGVLAPVEAIGNLAKFGDPGAAEIDPARRFARSSTGEIELDGDASTLRVVTPRSETLVMNRGGELHGEHLSVRSDRPGTFFAAAMEPDGTALADSGRILFFHLTDVVNSNILFKSARRTVVCEYGSRPLLAAAGRAEIALRLNRAGAVRVFPLKQNGRRQTAIPARFESGVLRFTADVGQSGEVPFAYEIIVEEIQGK